MTHRYAFAAVDRTLRDIRRTSTNDTGSNPHHRLVYGDERCNWCGSIISQFTDSSIQEGKACLFVQIPQALLERGSAPLRLIAFLAQMKFVPVHAIAELRIKSLRKANPWGIEIPV
uniref:Uncharacterized protein n=1 Tax=Oryza nivara TaxID=4536 RepID=A0A0E0HNP8_ORYNI